jgi:membrane carboxypeptidase/penicillin-binding protein PbpC
VERLVWYLDGKIVGESRQEPFAFPWQAARGEHTLEVRAYDLAGNEGKSEQVRFQVK